MTGKVWLHAHVEQMEETDEYMSMSRDEWDAMAGEQGAFLSQFALEAMNNAGGCGASVVDESEVPDEWKEDL